MSEFPVELPAHAKAAIKKSNRLMAVVGVGIAYSLFYTAFSLFLMSGMRDDLRDSCVSRQAARSAIRQALSNDPDWSAEDQAELDVNLPVRVSC